MRGEPEGPLSSGMPRQSDLYSRWSLAMRRGGVFRPGGRVGVAVSGGQDSMLLLHFVRQLGRETGFHPAVVHFNHHLRGAESNADERFVAETAQALKLEFFHSGADVGRTARDGRRNIEATARELRYRYFFSLVRQGKLDWVATAHTANDQAETVLLRVLRGTGTRGLGGIYPVLQGGVVRPFLTVTRAEVEDEVRKRGVAFRVDASNLDPRFARNKIRQHLIPRLEREFNPRVVLLLAGLAARCRDDDAYLEQQASEISRPWRIREGREERISTRALSEFPPALERRVLCQMAGTASAAPHRLTSLQIEQLQRLCSVAQSGKALALPAGVEAYREFDWLVVRPRNNEPPGDGFSYLITPPAEVDIPSGVFRIRSLEYAGRSDPERPYNSNEGVYIDFDTLDGTLILRSWKPGDRFCPRGCGNARKLKELFRESKIPAARRRNWPVLLNGDEIVWVRGFPPGGRFAATAATRR
ncbi:MAG: tRNA lysidine(34) synthetase TilS, partial [Terriglobia bacterium]